MFLQNKFTRLYFQIIKKYHNTSDTFEKHHIIPKSLGGSNDKSNIANLPHRVHFIVHKILPKITEGKDRVKMNFALYQMMNRKICVITSRDYAITRQIVSRQMVENNPMHYLEVHCKRKGVKRPKQSKVAKERNINYWKSRARPLRIFACPICNREIQTRYPERKTCSKKCAQALRKVKSGPVG